MTAAEFIAPEALKLKERYKDAYRVARTIISAGTFVKALGGLVLVLVLLLVFFVLANNGRGVGPTEVMMFGGGGFFGVVTGLVLYVFGVLISAQGQILRATLDSAVNSSPFLNNELRAEMMSLR